MTTRAVLYARVSSDDTGKGNLAGQLDMCREFAIAQGWHIVAELAEDERGVSGARMDAPALERALKMASEGKYDVLVAREMDRLARSLGKQLIIEEQLDHAGVSIAYVMQKFEDSPAGRLGKNTLASVAEFVREDIRVKTYRGRRRSVKAGNVMLHGGGAPYGYRKAENDGRAGLEIDETEAAVVRLVFDWYAAGETVRGIARKLTELQYPTPADKAGKNVPKKRGQGQWGPSSVDNLLKREAYIGRWQYGKYNNFTNERNPRDQYIAVEVPPIVDNQTWAEVQTRKANSKLMAARNTKHDYLLRARLTCGQCGASVGSQAVTLPNATYLYYRCNAAKNCQSYVHSCDMPQFRADFVDLAVWQWVTEVLASPEKMRAQVEAQRAQQEEARRPLRAQLEIINQLLVKQRQQLERALDTYLEGELARELLEERTEQLQTRIKALEVERVELTRRLEADVLTDDQLMTLEEFAAAIKARLPGADQHFDRRRALVDTANLRGKLLMIDGQQYVSLSGHLGESKPLFVSQTMSNQALCSASCHRR